MAHEHVDALLAGAALAIAPVVSPVGYRRLTDRFLRYRIDAIALLAYFIAAPYLVLAGNHAYDDYFFESLLAVSGAVAIHGLIERPRGAPARVLAYPVIRHIGIASYSLYLWQQPWLIPTHSMSPIVRLLGVFASAEASLWLIEKPFLRLKSRVPSPGADPATSAEAPEVRAREHEIPATAT
jgi:peptidoglycan/LPS O-acetylase OafA/YrhL